MLFVRQSPNVYAYDIEFPLPFYGVVARHRPHIQECIRQNTLHRRNTSFLAREVPNIVVDVSDFISEQRYFFMLFAEKSFMLFAEKSYFWCAKSPSAKFMVRLRLLPAYGA